MNIAKKMFLLAVAFLTVNASYAPRAQAHGGELILFLPVIVSYNAADAAWVSARIMHKGFAVDVASSLLSSVADNLIDKRNDLRYHFTSATNLADAKALCEKIDFRLASPEEVARLYDIRHVDRFERMITTSEARGSVLGFFDGEKDYFKLNVKTGELETYDRPSEAGLSPVICVSEIE